MNVNRQNRKNKVIYTCITGGYDNLHNHVFIDNSWDYVCYTDDLSIERSDNSKWEFKRLAFNKLDSVRNQRWHKIHPHLLFNEYKISLWVDGNVNIISKKVFDDVDKAMAEERKMALPVHPDRACIYDEFHACVALGKDDQKTMRRQIEVMKERGFPRNQGLFETNIIFRIHQNEKVIALMKDWWFWVQHYSRRDQLSLNYVLWNHKIKIEPLSQSSYRNTTDVLFAYGKNHLTKEELTIKLQSEVDNLREEIRRMKLSKFWKMRNLYLRIKGYLSNSFLNNKGP